MNDDFFKNNWNNFNDDDMEFISAEDISSGKFVKNRYSSIQKKIRKLIIQSLIIKGVSIFAFVLLLGLNDGTENVSTIGYLGIALALILIWIEYKQLKSFDEESNLAMSAKENLSAILKFIKKKAFLLGILTSTGQILIFVPGVMDYYFLTYGYIKPMTQLSFFVFSVLILIGMVGMFVNVTSQLKYNVKHITLCLSEINDENLFVLYQSIERDRKNDQIVKVLLWLVVILTFIVMIALLKSVVN